MYFKAKIVTWYFIFLLKIASLRFNYRMSTFLNSTRRRGIFLSFPTIYSILFYLVLSTNKCKKRSIWSIYLETASLGILNYRSYIDFRYFIHRDINKKLNSIEKTKIDVWTRLASLYFSLFVSIVRASWITNVGDFLLRNERPTYSYPRHAFNRATFNPAPDRVNRLYCITRRWHRGALAACLRLIRTRFFPSRACMSRHYHARERTSHSPLCRVITAWAKTIRDAMSHNTGLVVTTRDFVVFRNGRLPSGSPLLR